MSGGVAAAAPDTNSVLVVDTIAVVDFGPISETRLGTVSVGMTSDCKVWFNAQDVFHFAGGGANCAWAKQKLAAMIKADGVPEGFHRGRWKPVNRPREGGSGSWSFSLSTLKDFVKTQVLLARQSVAVGGAGARSLSTHLHVQPGLPSVGSRCSLLCCSQSLPLVTDSSAQGESVYAVECNCIIHV